MESVFLRTQWGQLAVYMLEFRGNMKALYKIACFFNVLRISLEVILYRIGVFIAIKLLRIRVCTNCVLQEKVQGRLDSNPDFK